MEKKLEEDQEERRKRFPILENWSEHPWTKFIISLTNFLRNELCDQPPNERAMY